MIKHPYCISSYDSKVCEVTYKCIFRRPWDVAPGINDFARFYKVSSQGIFTRCAGCTHWQKVGFHFVLQWFVMLHTKSLFRRPWDVAPEINDFARFYKVFLSRSLYEHWGYVFLQGFTRFLLQMPPDVCTNRARRTSNA